MCGRYQLGNAGLHIIQELVGFDVFEEHGASLPVRWNIAPTQLAPVVRVLGGERVVDELRWGLTPPWAKDLAFGARCINARAETVASKPAFRSALRGRRCLVPATGFYEWTKQKPKRPYLFRRPDRAGYALAGLWESWTDRATGEVVDTFAILTTAANDVVRPVHDRMPVILAPDGWGRWLDPDFRDGAALSELLARGDGGELVAREVDPAIGSASFVEEPTEVAPVVGDALENQDPPLPPEARQRGEPRGDRHAGRVGEGS